MTSPFAPKSRRAPSPARAPDRAPLVRLRRLGLRPEDEDEVHRRWSALSHAERFETMTAMENLDDDELRRQIAEMREDMAGATGPTTEADEVPHGTADEVLAWVGEDARRAQEALKAEQARGTRARRTLVARLRRLAGG